VGGGRSLHIWTPPLSESGGSGPPDPHRIAATAVYKLKIALSLEQKRNIDL